MTTRTRLFSLLLAVIMVISLMPMSALAADEHVHDGETLAVVAEDEAVEAAVCTCESDDPASHAPFCALYTAPEAPVCFCVEQCAEGSVNEWCDVCGFDYTACTGTDTAALYEDTTYPYAVVDTEAGTLTIDGTLGGKTTATEEDITALVEQLKAYVDSGNTTIIVTGSKPAMIEVSGLTITAIGEAIYRLSLDDSYNGKIDLILPDVTEIIDKEFYSAQALNSITLPKVTKLGSLAFYGTQYLRIITFGSVLTEVNETGGVMFAYVGNKVGGCDLILNCGQMNESSVPVPDLTINTWGYENEFKSITLTHTGGTATCSELAKCEVCGTEYGEVGAHTAEPTYVPNAGDSTQHDATYSCCGATVTEAHTMNVTTGKCVCGADMTAIATVTDGTNTYYAADAATLNQAVTAILETGSRTFTVELPADAEAGMITTIRRAICDTEGVADGSIHLTLKGVTTIPGTTNWDGVAFGPGDIYDEAGKIVDQELVTQLASINLPDVTEIGAQAFYFCENLVSVSAPKAQTIGAQAFGYTALTSVEFPELTTIPTDMFSGTWTLSSAKFPKVTTIEQSGLLVGAKFTPENNPTPFPLELTAEGNITFNGSNHFNIASQNYSGKVDLMLCCDKADKVTKNEDGTATWQVRNDLSYTFKSITFKHSYVDGKCTACGEVCEHEYDRGECIECGKECKHDYENGYCTICDEMCEHGFVDGICTECGMVCDHTFDDDGYCTVCGAFDNTGDAKLGDNTVALPEGCEGYYWTYIAEADGELLVTISGEKHWCYVINNKTTQMWGDTQWSDSDPVVNPCKVTVSKGDELEIVVSAYDPAIFWGYPAATLTVTLKYENSVAPFAFAGSNVKLGDSLDMFFYVKYSDLNGEGYYAEITRTFGDGTANEVTRVPYAEWEHYDSSMIRIAYTGLPAKAMTDDITVVVYNNDGVAVSETKTDSIKTYAMRIFDKQNDKTKKVLVDMLNYGAAAQKYFDNYNGNKLANADLTAEQQEAYATKTVSPVDSRVKGDNYAGSSVSLKSNLILTFYFYNLSTDMYAEITYVDHNGDAIKLVVDGEDFYARSNTMYGVDATGIKVADGMEMITCKVFDKDGNEVASATDSVESYIARMSETDEIFESVMKFVVSAYHYFES